MNYVIRLATKDDIKNLAILKQRVWDETYRGIYEDEIIDNLDFDKSEKTFEKIIDNDDIALYVVESGDELVGYMDAGATVRGYKDYEQEIGLLYLRRDFQGLGIGKKLFSIGYNKIKENGYDRFFISCNKYNTNARKFYEHMGGKLIYEDEECDDRRYAQAKFHYDVN